MSNIDMWSYPTQTTAADDLMKMDLSGFQVEARDGEIGKVDEATYDTGGSFVVVNTGPWIFGKKVMLPAGVIRDIDLDSETVFVDRTKDEIKNAPEFDEDRYKDESYRTDLGSYYGRSNPG